ncbi:MAG TPA: Asp-tRNA(Asn)/Glu-tRNA(Gln) amidotransferase subunit GatB [Candidatus Saccharimonadales bacterium]|nr:Asp-tRNA(Asn)/Glu-tRNA(Gln) amidotransferase subunit GatB [Candidatus Saccharimonadales bacterium]
MATKYIPTVGIETHVQLNTKTKLFAAVGNDARKAPPNTLISHICVGLPGALPVLNSAAVDLVTKAAFALNTKPQKFSKFDRKHYFYPDLPKGYQISQYEQPLIVGGHVHINVAGERICVGITRAHLEEDAGKNTHPPGADYSLVDLNRAGTPLLEIVSDPDIHSAAAAKAYARELYLLMKYAGATDGDMFHGHVRFDVNISVSKEPEKPGIRSEIKNLNSFRSVEGAVAYEIERQSQLLDKGQKVIQETRGWDEAKQKTTSQREKEEAHDYRYMPEPDVPPIELDDAYIDKIEKQMPELPPMLRQRLTEIKIDSKVIEDILDRPKAVNHILQILKSGGAEHARRATFWFLQAEPAIEEDPDYEEPPVDAQSIIKLSQMVSAGELSSTSAKTVFNKLLRSGGEPARIAQDLNLLQVSDESAIEKIVTDVIAENPQVAEDIKNGQSKAIGFLVGQVMAKSGGQANPGLAQKLIKKHLGV